MEKEEEREREAKTETESKKGERGGRHAFKKTVEGETI